MWNIFFKDFKEKSLQLVFSIVLPLLVPVISSILFKEFVEDATSLLYLVLFAFYLPIYLILISSSIFSDENLNLLKITPVSFWKIITSKLLFLIFNFLILAFIYFIFFYKSIIFKEEQLPLFVPLLYFYFLLIFLTFSFSNFIFKKTVSNFISLAIVLINFFTFYYFLMKTNLYVLTLSEIYVFYVFILILSIFFSYNSSYKKLLGVKTKFLIILLFSFAFITPPIYLFTQKEKIELHDIIFRYKFIVPIDERRIGIENYDKKEFYIYDLKEKKLSFFPQLYKLKIGKYDTKEKKIYYSTTFRKLKFCEENRICIYWHYYDFKKNKTNKIGFYPHNSLFLDKAVVWYDWIEKAKYNNYEIGFTDIEKKKCFYDLCKSKVYLKDGIVYKKYEENKYLLYYVDYQSFEKKLLFEGDFKLYYGFWFQKSVSNYCFILKDNKLFKIKFPSFETKEIGDFELLVDFKNGYYLTKKKDRDKINLYLYKDDIFIKKMELKNKSIRGRWEKNDFYAGILVEEKNLKRLSLLGIENEDIKIYDLPKNTVDLNLLLSMEEILLFKKFELPIFSLEFEKPYIYNFKKRKMRGL